MIADSFSIYSLLKKYNYHFRNSASSPKLLSRSPSRCSDLCILLLSLLNTPISIRSPTQSKRSVYLHFTLWTIIPISSNKTHSLNNTHAGVDSTEDSVLSIQKRGWFQRNKELAAVSICSCVCHRYDACPRVFKIACYFIFEFSTVNTLPT